jgi:hypothetical protein
MKKIYGMGIDQLIVAGMKEEGFTVVSFLDFPDPSNMDEDSILFLSADVVPFDKLEEIRGKYKVEILYLDNIRGISRWQTLTVKCQIMNIHYLSNRATLETVLEKLYILGNERNENNSRVIGFFGTGFSAGTTTISMIVAQRIAASGKNVLHLGLDLYDPGWTDKTNVSLDLWRPKLTARIIRKEDYDQLIIKDGFHILPGNFDFLGAQDFNEAEIEYLLARSQEEFDVIVADFGSICDSAAWYVGIQRSAIRVLVGKPDHANRLNPLNEVLKHLDLSLSDFFFLANQYESGSIIRGKDAIKDHGMNLLMEFPLSDNLKISIGKKEILKFDEIVRQFLIGLGFEMEERKRGLIS